MQTSASIDLGFVPQQQASIFIDADNQSARLAHDLVALVTTTLAADITQVIVAGNGNGTVNRNWLEALSPYLAPGVDIHSLIVPSRPDAADMALVVALSCRLSTLIATGTKIVIVSHDQMLEKLAVHANDLGAEACIVYSCLSAARNGLVETHAIGQVPRKIKPKTFQSKKQRKAARRKQRREWRTSRALQATEESVIAAQYLAACCTQQPAGGYDNSQIHSQLIRMGITNRAERNLMIRRLPNYRERASNGALLIRFDIPENWESSSLGR